MNPGKAGNKRCSMKIKAFVSQADAILSGS
jgi:hypothetical protein